MVAKTKALTLPFGLRTIGWVYEVCPRPSTKANACPVGSARQPLGGVRLALRRGDTLKVRLVNELPVVADAKHCSEPGHADLVNNPTNLHTHGLIVEPHRAEGPSDAYGDYVFLEVKNPANHGTCPGASSTKPTTTSATSLKICHAGASGLGVPGALHADMDVIDTAAEYSITIPKTHPVGMYWFHPHMHGISMNQITSGLAGTLSIGNVAEMCADDACRSQVLATDQNVLVLKDMQVEANGTLLDQQDSGFCSGTSDDGGGLAPLGNCLGVKAHKNGRWFHTINGQVYPSISVGEQGSVWRFVHASPSRFYNISLIGSDGSPIPMQVLAIDGGTVESSSPTSDPTLIQQALGPKASLVLCPGQTTPGQGGICVSSFKFLPSSRIDVRIVNPSSSAQTAVLQTAQFDTGASGDKWPAIFLANVSLAAPAAGSRMAVHVAGARAAMSDHGIFGQAATLSLPGSNLSVSPSQFRALTRLLAAVGPTLQDGLRQTPSYAIDPALKAGLRKDASCVPLPKGHRRRIYFGYPTPGTFGLGYVELDEHRKEVPGTLQPVRAYEPSNVSICLPLGAGDKPVNEVWELVNLTAEDHNFHIHQIHFRLIADNPLPDAVARSTELFVIHDSLPMRAGTAACDGTLETATAPGTRCKTTKDVIEIPFTEIGDFVYHCHVLEHEDGGMMAHIRVVPGP